MDFGFWIGRELCAALGKGEHRTWNIELPTLNRREEGCARRCRQPATRHATGMRRGVKLFNAGPMGWWFLATIHPLRYTICYTVL